MWFKYPIIFLVIALLALLQVSFLPAFSFFGAIPNMVFIAFFLITFFEKTDIGFFAALVAGFFLDVFLPSYFGISIVTLLLVYLLQKTIEYFFKKDQYKYILWYFIATFLASFFVYTLVLFLASLVLNFELNMGFEWVIAAIYSLILATGGFYAYKLAKGETTSENQLKLL